MDDSEPFLTRWSRRKLAAGDSSPADLPPVELPAAAPAAPAADAQASESAQGMSAEYREFFDPRVEEKQRRTALRELFGEPQFNVMDGLDTYIDDYSKPDPIPEAMLRRLNQAKELFLFDDEKQTEPGENLEAAAGSAADAIPQQLADSDTLSERPPARAADEVAQVATGPAPEQDGGRKND